MAFRTILTVVGGGSGDGDLRLAAGLCEEAQAHLSVLVLALAAPPPIGEYAAMVSEAWLDERRKDMDALKIRSAAVSAFVAASPVSADVSTAYPETAWADETIGRRARYADLTLVGPELAADKPLAEKVLDGALFSSGKPLLIVPAGAAPTLKPRRVIVGWDSRVEASRAVREALDLLVGAEEVRLVLVDPVQGEADHGEEPGADAAAYLARHRVRVTVDRLPSQNRSVADVLKRHALDTAADLLVMGGYGHSRLRERIFGGTTRSIIEQPTLPVFLAR